MSKIAQVVIKTVKEGNAKGTHQMSFVAKNGRQIFCTEAYVNRTHALYIWDSMECAIKQGWLVFDVDDTGVAPSGNRFAVQIYSVKEGNQKGKMALRLRGANYETIWTSEGYTSLDAAMNAWDCVEDAVLRNDFVIRFK